MRAAMLCTLALTLAIAAPVSALAETATTLPAADGCRIVDTHCYDPNSRDPNCLVYVVVLCIPE